MTTDTMAAHNCSVRKDSEGERGETHSLLMGGWWGGSGGGDGEGGVGG